MLLQATTVQITRTESAFDILMKGGWILIPLFLLSIVAIYFIIERYTLYRSYRLIDPSVIDKICKAIYFVLICTHRLVFVLVYFVCHSTLVL